MTVLFHSLSSEPPGTIARLLRESYAELLAADRRWSCSLEHWNDYDRDVFAFPDTVGACVVLTRLDGCLAGFASWDPRLAPELGIVGHNCILPEFRGLGLGVLQIGEVLTRLRSIGIQTARVATCDHPFFLPAQRMYTSCGFREVDRTPRDSAEFSSLIVYEMPLR